MPPEPAVIMFTDDGSVPNNPYLPFLHYRGGFDLAGTPDPEAAIERVLGRNGWGAFWRNGIYPYVHYHSMIHEVMAVARGHARVRFGGAQGRDIDLRTSDGVVLPAGTGHQCLSASADLVVIGAYPKTGRFDLCRGSRAEHDKAVITIADVPLPTSDPLFGPDGPLMRLWSR